MSGKVFGTRAKRLEDPALLRGRAQFIDDLRLPHTLNAAFVRSPFSHTKIGAVDASAALAMDGVHAVLTFADFAPLLVNPALVVGLPSPAYRQDRNRPLLAATEATYVGEPIAVVLADTRYIAEDAAAMVEVAFDPLPAAADCRDALEPDAPLVHSNSDHNICAEFDMAYGDVDAVFSQAAHVFEENLKMHRGGSHSMECRGCVAEHEVKTDQTILWSSTQMPHSLRTTFIDMTGRDESTIRVVTPDIGGGFGPKLVVYQEDICVALASKMMGRPIKWIEDRREHFTVTTQERDQYWDAEIAVDADGKILGIRGGVIHDHGAYTARGVNLAYNAAETVTLGYIVPHYRMNVKVVLTNKVPVTPVRGAGHPQGTFVMERLMDRVAKELGLPCTEVRLRNMVPGDAMPYDLPIETRGGVPIQLDSGDYPQCMKDALAAASYDDFPARQKAALGEGRYLGIGFANFVKGTGRGPFEMVTVRIGTSGKISVQTGGKDIGQGHKTMLAQIVGEQFGGDMDNVSIVDGDTAATSLGIGTSNSRLACMAGTSAHVAAGKVREKALKMASHMLEASEEDLEFMPGGIISVKGVPDMKIGLADVAKAVAGTPGYTLPGGISPGMEATETVVMDAMTYASGTAVAEVEVDIETGHVRIVNFVIGHDSGTVINPMLVDGQIFGGIAHGVGNALFEWMGFDEDAQPITTNFGEYLLVSAPEMPPVTMVHHESPSPVNPLGVKGVGECGGVPTPSAIVAAIENALTPFDVHVTDAPVTPSHLIELINEGRRAGAA
ncbi:MAG: xanthine dehydrogenase family protein molybdopterin-binding subunit [Rhodospirillaceae bacterium]|jgi:aerobic carbon-monoxide dehydrogenase large subunit|nr:xanthine dehydrogenase family protein molybdopterin-binding subunit [Rhodospirillaceae bacterium]MBT5456030.1 xanthine dehydrogenase family protein molybdopterin-binding subunit [Rhodospirillaceae bacterium]